MKTPQIDLYVKGDVKRTLINCKGYYSQPSGGPLVGYAGTYEVRVAGVMVERNFVGREYFNCAKAEQYPYVRQLWAEELVQQADFYHTSTDVVLGAPMGGILFADSLAHVLRCRIVFAEKKVTARAEVSGGRDKTELVLDRHEIEPGDKVLIAEDACNNFSTTSELMKLIVSHGGIPHGIACIVNRSGTCSYVSGNPILPVTSVGFIPTQQFKQEDPAVAEDMAKGNIVWKPKSLNNWTELMKLMK